MAIYAPPREAGPPPEMDYRAADFDQARKVYEEAWDVWETNLKAVLQKYNPGDLVGEIVSFPVADGYAQYMVSSMKPLKLVHLPRGDGYQFMYAHRLTAKDIREQIQREKALADLFKKTT